MKKMIIGIIIIIVILVIADHFITGTVSQPSRITVVEKYTTNDVYFIKTMSLETFVTTKSIYDKIDVGNTYTVKLYSNQILEVV